MITDRRALLEFTPDLARVLGEFLATPHAGRVWHRFQCTGVQKPRIPYLSEDVALIDLCGPQASTGLASAIRHPWPKLGLAPPPRNCSGTTRSGFLTLRVVTEPDKRPPQPRKSEVVAVQTFPERPQDRKSRDEHNCQQGRRGKQPGHSGFARLGDTHSLWHRSYRPAPPSSPARASAARMALAASASASRGSCCRLKARWRRTCRISDSSL